MSVLSLLLRQRNLLVALGLVVGDRSTGSWNGLHLSQLRPQLRITPGHCAHGICSLAKILVERTNPRLLGSGSAKRARQRLCAVLTGALGAEKNGQL